MAIHGPILTRYVVAVLAVYVDESVDAQEFQLTLDAAKKHRVSVESGQVLCV